MFNSKIIQSPGPLNSAGIKKSNFLINPALDIKRMSVGAPGEGLFHMLPAAPPILEKYIDGFRLENVKESQVMAFDIALLIEKDTRGFLEICETKKVIEIIRKIIFLDTKIAVDTKLLLDTKLSIDEKHIIYRNKQKIITLNEFTEFLKDNYAIQLKETRRTLYESYYPNIPSFLISLFLWLRYKITATTYVKFRGSEENQKDIVGALLALFNSFIEANNYVTDLVVLAKIYEYSKSEEDSSFMWLFTIRLLAILSQYLIAYSSGIQLMLNKGHFNPENYKNHDTSTKIFLNLFFTFISPSFFIFLAIFDVLLKIVKAFVNILIPMNCGFSRIIEFLESLPSKIGMDKGEYEGFFEQKSITQMMFQNIPILLADIFLVAGTFKVPGITRDSWVTIILALVATSVNLLIKGSMFYITAEFYKEDFLTYCLTCMKAKYGWIPFVNKIKFNQMTDKIIDFNLIRCPFPVLTQLIGYYSVLHYDFSELSIRRLTNSVNELKLSIEDSDQIQDISLSRCVSKVSIEELSILLSIATSGCIRINLQNMNWEGPINISKSMNIGKFTAPKKKIMISKKSQKKVFNEIDVSKDIAITQDIESNNFDHNLRKWEAFTIYKESIITMCTSTEKEGKISEIEVVLNKERKKVKKIVVPKKKKKNYEDEEADSDEEDSISFERELEAYSDSGEENEFDEEDEVDEEDEDDKGEESKKLQSKGQFRKENNLKIVTHAIEGMNRLRNSPKKLSRAATRNISRALTRKHTMKMLKLQNFEYEPLLKELLEKGADPDIPDIHGETPLMYTIRTRKYQSAEILLNNGANPNLCNMKPDMSVSFPLLQAVENLDLRAIHLLFETHVPDKSIGGDQTDKGIIENTGGIKFHERVEEGNDDVSVTMLSKLIDQIKEKINEIAKNNNGKQLKIIEEIFILLYERKVFVQFPEEKASLIHIIALSITLQIKNFDKQFLLLAENIEEISKFRDKDGNNLLHLIFKYMNCSLDYNDIRHYIEVSEIENMNNMTNNFGETPLAYALALVDSYSIKFAIFKLNLKQDYSQQNKVLKDNLTMFCNRAIMNWQLRSDEIKPILLAFFKPLHTVLLQYILEDQKIHNQIQLEMAHQLVASPDDFITDFGLSSNPEELKSFTTQQIKIKLYQKKDKLLIKTQQHKKEEMRIEEIMIPTIRSSVEPDFNQASATTLTQSGSARLLGFHALGAGMGKIFNVQQASSLGSAFMQKGFMNSKNSYESNINIVGVIMSILLESAALFDLITDIIVLYTLITTNETSWAGISILTMLTPYLISHAPLITFFMERGTFEKKSEDSISIQRFLGAFFLTPLCLIYFIILDVFYNLTELLLSFWYLLYYMITCGSSKKGGYEEYLDKFYQSAFKLNEMDVKGLRRLRTISQMIFETVPQLILQLIILSELDPIKNPQVLNNLYISVGFGLIHLSLEITLLQIESKTYKSSFRFYSVLCLNGRLNWVPLLDSMTKKTNYKTYYKEINYENFKIPLCCGTTFELKFEFQNSTVSKLSQTVLNIPLSKNYRNQVQIKLMKKCRNIDLDNLLVLFKMVWLRVKIDVENTQWDKIITQTFPKNIPKDPLNKNNENYIVLFANLDCPYAVKFFLEQNCNLPEVKRSYGNEVKSITFIQYLYEKKLRRVFKVLLDLNYSISGESYTDNWIWKLHIENPPNNLEKMFDKRYFNFLLAILGHPNVILSPFMIDEFLFKATRLVQIYQKVQNGLRITSILGLHHHQGIKLISAIKEEIDKVTKPIWIKCLQCDSAIEFQVSIIEKLKFLCAYLPGQRPIGSEITKQGWGSQMKPYDLTVYDICMEPFLFLCGILQLKEPAMPLVVKDKKIDGTLLYEIDKVADTLRIQPFSFQEYYNNTRELRVEQYLEFEYNDINISYQAEDEMKKNNYFNSRQSILAKFSGCVKKIGGLQISVSEHNVAAFKSIEFDEVKIEKIEKEFDDIGKMQLIMLVKTTSDYFDEELFELKEDIEIKDIKNIMDDQIKNMFLFRIPGNNLNIQFYVKYHQTIKKYIKKIKGRFVYYEKNKYK